MSSGDDDYGNPQRELDALRSECKRWRESHDEQVRDNRALRQHNDALRAARDKLAKANAALHLLAAAYRTKSRPKESLLDRLIETENAVDADPLCKEGA